MCWRLLVAASVGWAACSASHGRLPYVCDPSPCDDGDPCNGTEVCDTEEGCLAGVAVDCSDFDPCSRDTCRAGVCEHEPTDRDDDGFADACAGGDDCAAMDADVHPGAPEICNGIDDDCDGDVDEGGAQEILEERRLIVDDTLGWSGPEVILGDGRAIGWSHRGLLAVSAGGTEERALGGSIDDTPPGVVGPTRAAAVRGDEAVLARLWGTKRSTARGASRRDIEAIPTYRLHAGRALADESFIDLDEFPYRPSERRFTAPIALSWQGERPFLAFHSWRLGRPDVVGLPLDRPDSTRAFRANGDVDDIAVAQDGEATTILWSERGADGSAVTRASTSSFQAQTLDAMPGALSACSVGRTVVLASGTEISLLDASLARRPLVRLDREPIEVRCAGSTVWALEPGRLSHVLEDGTIDFVDEELLEGTRFIATSGAVWLGAHAAAPDEWVLRRYGCAP